MRDRDPEAPCPHCDKALKWVSSSTDRSKEDRVTHTDKFRCLDCGFQRTEKS